MKKYQLVVKEGCLVSADTLRIWQKALDKTQEAGLITGDTIFGVQSMFFWSTTEWEPDFWFDVNLNCDVIEYDYAESLDSKINDLAKAHGMNRASVVAESMNIIRTLLSNKVQFEILVGQTYITFWFRGIVHILTAQRLLAGSHQLIEGVENVAELTLAWDSE